jgi:hypothetical protein
MSQLMLRHNIGMLLQHHGQHTAAIDLFRINLAKPGSAPSFHSVFDIATLFGLTVSLGLTGQVVEALHHANRAVAAVDRLPVRVQPALENFRFVAKALAEAARAGIESPVSWSAAVEAIQIGNR